MSWQRYATDSKKSSKRFSGLSLLIMAFAGCGLWEASFYIFATESSITLRLISGLGCLLGLSASVEIPPRLASYHDPIAHPMSRERSSHQKRNFKLMIWVSWFLFGSMALVASLVIFLNFWFWLGPLAVWIACGCLVFADWAEKGQLSLRQPSLRR